ncbi:MAG: acetyl-CoA hydrolase/transferase family protein [Deltaproteobacteria bacterium]|nr:MAG: acetyl-CoA hydrolase/transferase family protein [Deltaproteobacteria bacterium]
MEPWQHTYKDKLISAEAAAKLVKSGDLVRLHIGKPPIPILDALAKRKGEVENVTVIQCYPLYNHLIWNEPGYEQSFNLVVDYVGVGCRQGMQKHYVDFLPIDYPQYAKQLEDGRTNTWEPDIFFGVVSPPDEKGYCSFGNALWYNKDVAKNAKVFVAEVDPTFIRTHGDNWIHVSEIDYLVEETKPFPVGTAAPPEEERGTLEVIGEFAASLIRDGDTVQMGIGAISEATGLVLMDRNDLGIHSELMTASHVELVKRGVATGQYKTLHKGKAVAAMVVGSADLEYVNNNPAFELYSVLYTNALPTIAAQNHQVAVNSTLALDLTGQAAAESLGPQMYSGIGGQMAFMLGALYSKGGRSIMVLPATAKKGQLSRLVPMLEPGSTLTTPRQYLDFVITEFGIVNLQGKTQRQRAEALISIAHPDFRPELIFARN